MATNAAPLSPAHLMTLGMFVFGMDTATYHEFTRKMSWRHEEKNRHMARAKAQFLGPGDDAVMIAGRLVPEIAGRYSSLKTLIEMADTGGNWPLMDGLGFVLGHYRIEHIDQAYRDILAGGIPRSIDFTVELKREK